MEKLEFSAMGTQMMAAIDRDGPRTRQMLEQVPHWFEAWEQCFSRFRPDSELSQINRLSGQDIKVSSMMQEVLLAALDASRRSGGLVTPTILDALEVAGYDRSLELVLAGTSSSQAVENHQEQVQWISSTITIEPKTRMLHLSPGTHIDLGGIAKGWAADQAVRRLKRFGPALVDAGGDISVSGMMREGEAWPIGVTDPGDSQRQIDLILLDRGGVATSGRDRRRWMRDKIWQHHIIDPRIGQPAQTDVLRVTVIGPSAQAAEMAAKVVLISGADQGLEWLEKHASFAGLIILEDGELIYSRRWINYSWR